MRGSALRLQLVMTKFGTPRVRVAYTVSIRPAR
jgi:hypothetical protein